MRPPTPPAIVAAILADYTAGMSAAAAAKKWGVSSTAADRIVAKAGIARGNKAAKRLAAQQRHDAEFGLPEGRWVPNHRGVLVWRSNDVA